MRERRCHCLSASHGPYCPMLDDMPDPEPDLPPIMKGSEVRTPRGERCRRCAKVIARDGHDGHCSSDCAEAARVEVSQATLRRQVYLRDGGICSGCGLDAEKLRVELDGLKRDAPVVHNGANRYYARVFQLVRLGFSRSDVEEGRSLWDLHHALERAAGGAHTLENSQTRCGACHSKETKRFAKSRSVKRRPGGRR